MATLTKIKSARLNCRIRPALKDKAKEAATLLGMSITEFAERALEEKVQRPSQDRLRNRLKKRSKRSLNTMLIAT